MEDIFRTITSNSYFFICDEIKYISTCREAIKELGEPIIIDKNTSSIFVYNEENIMVGFLLYEREKILYAYTLPKFRRKGVLSIAYNELPNRDIYHVVSSNMSLDFFLSKGFKVVKKYKNCHKLKLVL